MTKPHWHILRDGAALTVARRLPIGFDICAKTQVPECGLLRLATQICQDMWRALQSLRGLLPVVCVTTENGAICVQAGGQVDAPSFPRAQSVARIAALLNDPTYHARWTAYVSGGRHG